jgi:hypothetical protein
MLKEDFLCGESVGHNVRVDYLVIFVTLMDSGD